MEFSERLTLAKNGNQGQQMSLYKQFKYLALATIKDSGLIDHKDELMQEFAVLLFESIHTFKELPELMDDKNWDEPENTDNRDVCRLTLMFAGYLKKVFRFKLMETKRTVYSPFNFSRNAYAVIKKHEYNPDLSAKEISELIGYGENNVNTVMINHCNRHLSSAIYSASYESQAYYSSDLDDMIDQSTTTYGEAEQIEMQDILQKTLMAIEKFNFAFSEQNLDWVYKVEFLGHTTKELSETCGHEMRAIRRNVLNTLQGIRSALEGCNIETSLNAD